MGHKDIDIQELSKAIASLDTEEEVREFLEDLCAPNELKSMNHRFKVMSLLCEKRVYTDIMDQTGASSATISRVKRVLEYGTGTLEKTILKMKQE